MELVSETANTATYRVHKKDYVTMKSPHFTANGRKYTIVTSGKTDDKPPVYYHDVKNDRGEYKRMSHNELIALAQS